MNEPQISHAWCRISFKISFNTGNLFPRYYTYFVATYGLTRTQMEISLALQCFWIWEAWIKDRTDSSNRTLLFNASTIINNVHWSLVLSLVLTSSCSWVPGPPPWSKPPAALGDVSHKQTDQAAAAAYATNNPPGNCARIIDVVCFSVFDCAVTHVMMLRGVIG